MPPISRETRPAVAGDTAKPEAADAVRLRDVQARLLERQELRDAIWAQVDDDGDQSAVRLSCRQFCADMDAVQPQRIKRDAALAVRAWVSGDAVEAAETRLLGRTDSFVVPPNRNNAALRHGPSGVAQALAARCDYREVRLSACYNPHDSDGIKVAPAWVRPLGQAIAEQTALKVLDLAGPAWNAAPISRGLSPHLGQLTNLRELHLGKTDMAALATIVAANPDLRKLAFVCPQGGTSLQSLLPALSACRRLHALEMGKPSLTSGVWQQFLRAIANWSGLQHLALDRPRFVEEKPNLTERWPEHWDDTPTNLTTMRLTHCDDDAMAQVFEQLLNNAPKLTALKLSGAEDATSQGPMLAMAGLAGRCVSLQKLHLETEMLAEDDCEIIRQALINKLELTQMQLRFDFWVDGISGLDARRVFSAMSDLPKLTLLEISGGHGAMLEPQAAPQAPLPQRFDALQSLTYKGSPVSTSDNSDLLHVLGIAPNLFSLSVRFDVLLEALPGGLPKQVHTWEAHLDLLDDAGRFCDYVNSSPHVTRLQVSRAGCLSGVKLQGAGRKPKPVLHNVQHLEFLDGYNFYGAVPFYAPQMQTLRLAPQLAMPLVINSGTLGNFMNLVVHAPKLKEIVIETSLAEPVLGLSFLRRALTRHRGSAVSLRSEPVAV